MGRGLRRAAAAPGRGARPKRVVRVPCGSAHRTAAERSPAVVARGAASRGAQDGSGARAAVLRRRTGCRQPAGRWRGAVVGSPSLWYGVLVRENVRLLEIDVVLSLLLLQCTSS